MPGEPSIGAMVEELAPFAGSAEDLSGTNAVVKLARSAWSRAMTGVELSRMESRQLLVYFGINHVRDHLLADLIDPDVSTLEGFEDIFLGKTGSPPDRERLARAGLAMTNLASFYEEETDDVADMAPILCCLAWVLWMMGGDMDKVHESLATAVRVAPDYALANLMILLILVAKVKPRWAV